MQNNTDSLMLLYNKWQVPSYQGKHILVWLFISEKKNVEEFREKQKKEELWNFSILRQNKEVETVQKENSKEVMD